MPTYLVERYLPGRDRAWLEAALARLRKTTNRAAHLGSTYVPADDACFCRFEAETADDVRDANEIAGVPFARIVAAEEIGIGQPGPTEKGDALMKRTLALVFAVAAAGIVATAGSATPTETERSSSRDEGVLAVRRHGGSVLHDHVLEHPGSRPG